MSVLGNVRASLWAWSKDVGKWWWSLAGAALVVLSLYALVHQSRRHLGWLVAAACVLLLIASFVAYHKERGRRLGATSAPHTPPGGGVPLYPPVEYQVEALRQCVRAFRDAGPNFAEFGRSELHSMFQNLPRTGTNPVYEPMHGVSTTEGLARLVELGELVVVKPGTWKIAV